MSTYYYGPALDSEISYRRDGLIRDAAVTRLARQARQFRRAASRTAPAVRPVPAPAEASVAAGTRDQVTRAA